MKINTYQLQHEIFTKIADGITKRELWDELRGRMQELRHLCQGGNPSIKEYREEMSNVASTIRKQFEDAAEAGPFAVRNLALRFQAIELSGKVCEDIMSLEPANLTDVDDIGDSFNRLNSSINQDALRDCDLLLEGKYTADIDAIYGKPEGAKGAADLT